MSDPDQPLSPSSSDTPQPRQGATHGEAESSQHIPAELMHQLQAIEARFRQETQSRLEVEAALSISEQRLRKIFEYSNDAIFVIDPQGDRILEANPKAAEMLGYSRKELLTSVRISTIHPDEMPQLRAFSKQVREQGYGWTNELTCLTQSGYKLPAEISASVVPFNGGTHIIAIVRDVTERRASEAALRASEARFRAFVDHAIDAFFILAMDGQIVDVNPQACKALGYSREELLQLAVTDIQVGQTPEQLRTMRQHLQAERPFVVEGVHRRKDGTTFPVETSLCRFEGSEQPLILALARNITERKQAQAAMERLAEIGELSAMIVHEVRSPLTTVLMGLESFQTMELPERAQRRLSLALEEAERLKNLLNEILQYTREPTLELTDIDLVALSQTLRTTLAELPVAQGRSIHLESSLPEAWIKGDIDKLKQVFINLVRNACEAVAPGETVTWRIAPDTRPDWVRITIHNGGDPIPPKVLARLGQPFFTTKSGGNGLGVAIVKRIVAAHGGELVIESTAEAGTTVRVMLPHKPHKSVTHSQPLTPNP
ncbi:PAS domain-containing sensor histidine kinase [Nodosilinea sp. P-1105]|uniref:PAS domain-containing sensor histidine kinase n=1 Tax=Nodosilinea sp. P-1105 TaxID=2546229 RepID=UPI00146F63A7|nr:PAS domain-containing sensor histidine kinase [Nodosilinea sp. P-1105]